MTVQLDSLLKSPAKPSSETTMKAPTAEQPTRCPVDHKALMAQGLSMQKTVRTAPAPGQPVEEDAAGVWHVHSYEAAKSILRSDYTKQAGFGAELFERIPGQMRPPVLYQEGEAHLQQRTQIARFFTPRTTSTRYRQLMEALSDQMIVQLRQAGRADLSQLSMKLAVGVAGQVVGLTNSRLPGMDRRLNAFFAHSDAQATQATTVTTGGLLTRIGKLLRQWRVALFFYVDVQPAIAARRRQRQEDVISHLLDSGYSDSEILIECITYAAAGMATTREFISVVAWHLLENPSLHQQYLKGSDEERNRLLQEALRLEPVIGNLRRRATADIHLEHNGQAITIPSGALIDLNIVNTNLDEEVVGEQARRLCPERQLKGERVPPAMMSFGDGHHRCPGAYIAIQETDIFLQRLLRVDGLRIEHAPELSWSELTKGYELRNFMVTASK